MVLFSGFIIIIFLLIIVHLNVIICFKEKRNYIKMEKSRSIDEERYRYWKAELKRLYLESTPVIGKFLKKLFG